MSRRRSTIRSGSALAALALATAVVTACGPGSTATPMSLPVPSTGVVTFYLSLPDSSSRLMQAANAAATPGSGQYRHFASPDAVARQYGATDAQITTAATSIKALGLQFAADPTRLFARVMGTP